MDLDEVADELYGVAPGDFVAARTEAARRARAAGDRALAREVAALGKPSTAAWACNALVREHPDEIAGLVELGGLMREAQDSLAGDQLRALGTQRSRLLAALTRQARAVAARLGHPLSDAVADQVEQTLRAALADPAAGEALLAGRLTGALSSTGTGLGSRPDLRVVPPPAGRAPAAPAAGGRARDRRTAEEEQRRAAEEERRRAAEEERWRRELTDAREDAEAAADLADEAARSARAARDRAGRAARRAGELAARTEELAAELARVREEAVAAEAEAGTAQRRAGAADRAAQRAAADRDRAAARVAELEAAPPGG
ncbi:hypothetical protein SAMN05660359_03461 [Geodermatophilus obscurus]|uniref:Uncharacterized protein n=1 Tax=Geodermatophilus obscurus TaxID=1861 RepID=A0A1I5H621_9ACTN|nr:hypothetical protein [Geodermatophilus obscurus]SFO43540.1 hypothetical protein SAMN05660359_03461 [Geodermatophilus obscurus]